MLLLIGITHRLSQQSHNLPELHPRKKEKADDLFFEVQIKCNGGIVKQYASIHVTYPDVRHNGRFLYQKSNFLMKYLPFSAR